MLIYNITRAFLFNSRNYDLVTNKDNYKKALKSGDYEEPKDGEGGEEKGKEDPGKLSGSDFDRQADKDDKPKEEPKESALDKIPSGDDAYKRTMEMSSE